MPKHDQDIENVRKSVGWVYDDLRWVTEKEAATAQRERRELLDFLQDRVNFSFSGTKPHTGSLSRGCRICGEGFWSCMFINQLCSADCFFCPQDRKVTKDDLPCTGHGMVFREMEDYVDFLAYAGYRGVGFSGGEPLLAFDKLLAYIKRIRERHGNDLYLWLYTNGDLVDQEKLITLRDHGLNEIRFNICADNYGLESVKKAVGVIDTVTVEIPAIPEDFETVKKSMALMQELGVSHLNLHQLLVTMYNYRELKARNYTFLHQESISVLESELTALRLMKYAVENNITLPINYCNSFYKSQFQVKGNRERIASPVMEEREELTEAGYIRKLEVQGEGEAGSMVRGHELQKFDLGGCHLVVSYYEPSLKSALASPETGPGSFTLIQDKIAIGRILSARLELTEAVAINGFYQLFFEKKDETTVRRDLLANCQAKTRDDLRNMMETINRIISLEKYEQTGKGFPDIY
ncbi:MAG: radical SAM protein [Candidatus Aminicenantes bacterium]|nr:radical SAM protein [Candidatus Aminicenantes bacterium]